MSDEPKDQPQKIIIDEDWKSQVEREREEASHPRQSPDSPAPDSPAAESPPAALPTPNLTFLAGNLYLQGMISLGLLPNPGSDKPEVHLDQAKHTIDLLQMLYEKTEGNRTPEETKEIDTILHELHLSYLAVGQQQEQPAGTDDVKPTDSLSFP